MGASEAKTAQENVIGPETKQKEKDEPQKDTSIPTQSNADNETERKRSVGIQTTSNCDLGELSDSIKALLLDADNFDVSLAVSGRVFQAHKLILRARSPVFNRMFQHDMVEQRSGRVEIPDCDPRAFEVYLQYLYSGSFDGISDDTASNLIHITSKYGPERLGLRCLEFMEKNLSTCTFCSFVSSALLEGGAEDEASSFLEAAVEFFADHFEEIGDSSGWKDFFKANPLQANELMLKAHRRCTSRK